MRKSRRLTPAPMVIWPNHLTDVYWWRILVQSCGGLLVTVQQQFLVCHLVVGLSHNYPKAGEIRLKLTAKEFWIIGFLALRKGAVLSIDAFSNHLCGAIDERETKIIDAFICNRRRKLAESGAKGPCVDEVWRQGYIRREPAIIWCCKKWASRHPLFVEAVPAPSNSSPVWTGLAHSLTTTPSLSITWNEIYCPMPPLFANGAAWAFLHQIDLPATI